MPKHPSPRGIASLPVLAIVLVLAVIVAGAVYFPNRDRRNTSIVVTTNTSNLNNTHSVANTLNTTPGDQNLNTLSNTDTISNVNTPSSLITYTSDPWGYAFRYYDTLHVTDNTTINSAAYDGHLLSDITVPYEGGSTYVTVDIVDDAQPAVTAYLSTLDGVPVWTDTQLAGVPAKQGVAQYGRDTSLVYYVLTWRQKTLVLSCFDNVCGTVLPTFALVR